MTKAPPSALDGVVVLDLSRVLAGPWATQIFADLGATVIKVERPGVGDDTRAWGPPFTSSGDAAYFLAANRNKQSVAIDFTDPDGADLVRALADRAQVVVENFKTGGLAKYGLDYPSLSARNPSLVYCSLTGFGHDGPYAARPGYDYLIQAMGGLMSITGQPDGTPGAEPMKVGVAVADLFTGMYAAVGVLGALRHAERTGAGQHLDIALLDCQVAMLANQAMNFLASGAPPERLGNQHPNIAPYQVFPTADGHLVLAVGNDGQFKAFCQAAGSPALADDPRFAGNAQRVANRGALIEAITPLLLAKSTADWIAHLEAAGVPCGPINRIDQVFEDAQVKSRGLRQTITRADGAMLDLVRSPLRLQATPPQLKSAPPLLGQDTAEVLTSWLDLAPERVRALTDRGVIGVRTP